MMVGLKAWWLPTTQPRRLCRAAAVSGAGGPAAPDTAGRGRLIMSRRPFGTVRALLAVTSLRLMLALIALPQSGSVVSKVLLLQTELFPDAPVRPLLWVTPAPRHEEFSFEIPGSHIESDLYLPATAGRHGGVILYTGAFGLRRDPAMVRFAEGLARAGAVVLVPESTAFRQGDIRPEEVDGLLRLVGYLRERSEVDPNRIGVLGFSAGGALVLLAAEDERGRDQIAFVHVMGAYYDALEILREVASREILVDGRRRPWEPDEVTLWEFSKLIIAALPEERDREILTRVFLDKQPEAWAELEQLSPDGQLALELFQRPPPERVDEIVGALPASSRAHLAAISPSQNVSQLRARLYMIHGPADRFIAVTQSRRLAAEAPPGTLRRYTESELFEHVTLDTQPGPLVLLRELPGLAYHVWLVGQEFL